MTARVRNVRAKENNTQLSTLLRYNYIKTLLSTRKVNSIGAGYSEAAEARSGGRSYAVRRPSALLDRSKDSLLGRAEKMKGELL